MHPESKPWFIVQAPDGLYIDHTCPFGCASSSSNAGMIGNAIADIWSAEGVKPLFKYEDDLSVFRFPDNVAPPFTFGYDRSSALARISALGVPWHPDKRQGFSPIFTYLGFAWDITPKRVSLPKDKRLKFLSRCSTFLKDIQRVDRSLRPPPV